LEVSVKKGTRQVDAAARMTLFRDFAGATVIIERVSPEEIRVRKIRARKRKYTLAELVAGITPKNRHDEITTGRPVGAEAW
jgi:antitoxin component of MazEF toxin-antitoxin module